jgi:hypothetical protein
VFCEPLAATGPFQSPEAVQVEALLEAHVNVEDSPASIVVGDAVNETVGMGGGVPAPPPHADRAIGPMIRRQYKERTPSQRSIFRQFRSLEVP